MNSTTAAIRELARRLIVDEPLRRAMPTAGQSEVARECERLRLPLTKLAGSAGYRSLISRALAMAKSEVPVLGPVQVGADGSLEGLEELSQNDAEAGIAVLTQLLSLLVIFIGESLTLVLIHDAWPDAPLNKTDLRAEEKP